MEVILLDPNSLTQHIKQANIQTYFWVHCMIKDMQQRNPCLSDWKREEEIGTLIPLWYDCNQFPQRMSKHQRPSPHKRA